MNLDSSLAPYVVVRVSGKVKVGPNVIKMLSMQVKMK